MRATVASDIERLSRDALFFHVNGSEISLSALGTYMFLSAGYIFIDYGCCSLTQVVLEPALLRKAFFLTSAKPTFNFCERVRRALF
jgi:hypothetical protein